MANTIKLKQGSGSDPSASDLVLGEPAVRTDTAEIFLKKDDGTVAKLSGGGLSDGDKGDITVSNSAATFTIDSGVIDNANIASNAAIAGTKIDPDFGSQNIETSGNITSPVLVAQGASGSGDGIILLNSGGGTNADFARIRQVLSDDSFVIENKATGSYVSRFSIASDGTVTIPNNLDCSAGIDVTGGITTTGIIEITNVTPQIQFVDSDHDPDFTLIASSGTFSIQRSGIGAELSVSANQVDVSGNLDVGSGLDVTGAITSTGNITITNDLPKVLFVDSGNNPDYQLQNENGTFKVKDATNGVDRLTITSDGYVRLPNDTQFLQIGASQDFDLHHNGTNSFIRNSTGNLHIRPLAAEEGIILKPNAEVELYFDNSQKLETRSNGITVTGYTYSDGVTIGNGTDEKYLAGDASQLEIYHTGSSGNGYINNSTGTLLIGGPIVSFTNQANNAFLIRAVDGGTAELYHNGNKKLETTSSGITCTGEITTDAISMSDNDELRLGNSDDFVLKHDGTRNLLNANNCDTFISPKSGETAAIFELNNAVELYFDNSKKAETSSGGFQVTGNLGFTSNNSLIHTGSSGNTLSIQGGATNMGGLIELRGGNSDGDIRMFAQGATSTKVERLRINSSGVTMSSNISFPDQKELILGGNTDLRLYHDGHSIIRNDETGAAMFISSHETIMANTSFNEAQAKFIQNGAVELYYDASKKAETVSGGFTISGTCTATSFSGSGANLTNLPSPTVENAAFAWINFSSTTNSIRGSYNVSSISDHGTGNFSVNFTNNASNNNYAVQINGTQTTSNTAISFLLSHSGPNLNSNSYSDGNFSTSSFRWVMGYGPSSVSMDSKLVCATVHES